MSKCKHTKIGKPTQLILLNTDGQTAEAHSQGRINTLLPGLLKRETLGKTINIEFNISAPCCLPNLQEFDVDSINRNKGSVYIARKKLPSTKFHRIGVGKNPSFIKIWEDLFEAIFSTELIKHLYSHHQLRHIGKSV